MKIMQQLLELKVQLPKISKHEERIWQHIYDNVCMHVYSHQPGIGDPS